MFSKVVALLYRFLTIFRPSKAVVSRLSNKPVTLFSLFCILCTKHVQIWNGTRRQESSKALPGRRIKRGGIILRARFLKV